MKALCQVIDKLLKFSLVSLFGLLVAVTVWQVFSRYVLASPSAFTEETARYLLIWVSMLGASYVFRMKLNIGMDLLAKNLQGRLKYVTEFIALVAIGLFALLIMVVGGVGLVELTYSLNQVSAILGIRMAFVYLVIPISGVFILIYTLEELNSRDNNY